MAPSGGRHPRPSLILPSAAVSPAISIRSIEYNATSLTATIASTQAFDEIESGYSCKRTRDRRTRGQSQFEPFSKDTSPPSLPTPLTKTSITWHFSIGTGFGECVHQRNIGFTVRVRHSRNTRWSRPVSTELSIKPPPPAGPPERVEANGDSSDLSDNKGQSEAEWSSVRYASSYELRYCTGDPCKWSKLISTTGTSTVIPDLMIRDYTADEDILYHIQVRAVNISDTSDWSDVIYTFPTHQPAMKGDTVGIVPILGFLPSAKYKFTICDNASFTIADSWAEQVSNGMETWESATGRMVRVNHKPDGICNDDSTNTVERVTKAQIESSMWCNKSGVDGCGRISLSTSVIGKIVRVENALLSTLAEVHRMPTGEKETGRMCTRLFQVAMHEAGHALGLDDHTNSASLMYSSEPYCFPTAYDIVAIKAIYQSR